MSVAHGALFHKQEPITDVLGMVGALEPIAGKTALTLFFFGTLSAGLSSVFPCLLIAPLLIEDYRSGKLDTKSRQFRIITGVASVLALAIPVLGFNPIKGQLLTQVFNVFVLPLVVAGIIVVVNKRNLMGEHVAGHGLNVLLGLAFLFSVVISYNGILAIGAQLG
jgi:manganese transport protein